MEAVATVVTVVETEKDHEATEEEAEEEEAAEETAEETAPARKNRIQVSTNKKPLYFYVNLAKRYMQHHNEVELSALGMEILTSTVGTKDEAKGGLVRKAKIEILLGKSENFSSLLSANKVDRIKAVEQEI